MNNQLARSLFMDYLYDEISEEEKKKLLAYLEEHPELRQELDKLKQTRSLLQQMPAEEPDRKLLMVEPRKRSFSQWWQDAKNLLPQTGWGKTGFAAAAAAILFIFVASAANLQFESNAQGFSLQFGDIPEAGLTEQQAAELIQQIRQENAIMLEQYAQSINEQNQQQLQQVVQYFEQQRRNDLQLIDHSFTQMQENTTEQWLTTNRYLGNLLQNVNFQNQNE